MYNKVLTGILVALLIAIIGIFGYLCYQHVRSYNIKSDAEEFLQEFDTIVVPISENEPNTTNEQIPEQNNTGSNSNTSVKPNTQNNATTNGLYYKGYKVVGKLEMPTINIKYPILGDATHAKAIEVSIIKIYGPNPNEPGNLVIAGHNYNNSLFFGKNKNLQIGEKIYITDLGGNRVEYTIYKKYYTPESDNSYITRNTDGKTEVTLYTCDATGKNRLIIFARAD